MSTTDSKPEIVATESLRDKDIYIPIYAVDPKSGQAELLYLNLGLDRLRDLFSPRDLSTLSRKIPNDESSGSQSGSSSTGPSQDQFPAESDPQTRPVPSAIRTGESYLHVASASTAGHNVSRGRTLARDVSSESHSAQRLTVDHTRYAAAGQWGPASTSAVHHNPEVITQILRRPPEGSNISSTAGHSQQMRKACIHPPPGFLSRELTSTMASNSNEPDSYYPETHQCSNVVNIRDNDGSHNYDPHLWPYPVTTTRIASDSTGYVLKSGTGTSLATDLRTPETIPTTISYASSQRQLPNNLIPIDNALQRFTSECCFENPEAEVSRNHLQLAYEKWNADVGEISVAGNVMAEYFGQLFKTIKRSKHFYYQGLKLKPEFSDVNG